jgi:DNA-binding transcriptional regulator YdaS (Cro superfamily)
MSADLAILLEHATGGELTARELRPDLPWPTPPASREDAATH